MADLLAELRAVFCEALERSAPGERAAYLDQACQGKPQLRARVEQLLQAQREASGFLQEACAALQDTAPEGTAVPEQPGTAVGPFTLVEQIGEGGFGIVYRAEQQQPVRREVALKVLKPGMDTRQVVGRFEAERQVLALMDHPNIARVLDGGTTADGRPYFVMELVRGAPITEHCDQNRLPPRERLALFADVCHAVQHAHHKGIIHRDVKPSNVLVALRDGRPVVKVIDFGIAKALGERLTDKTLSTGLAQVMGTPLYMSPEQAGLSGLDVDTRTDIYALGVLLYELLTGTTPFDRQRLGGASHDEMRRIIREEEPPRPSTRVGTLGPEALTVSARRQTDPKRLSQLCRGEVDWIVMKALEKDRRRRYETASAFAADVQRYLRDEPVAAGPPSAWYRVRKFARRRRGAIAMATMTAAALVLVTGAAWWSERRQAAMAAAQRVREDALDAEVNRAADEAVALIDEGKRSEALSAVQRAEKLLTADGRPDLPERLRELRTDLDMARRLEEIYGQLDPAEATTVRELEAEYARVFREYGIDVTALPAEEVAERMRARHIRRDLARALDFWSRARRGGRPGADWKALLALAKAADPDPWRNQLRDALANDDRKGLEALARSADIPQLPSATLLLLGNALAEIGAGEQARALLRTAQGRFPGDLWINTDLAWLCFYARPARYDDSVRYYTAALAVSPNSHYITRHLAYALLRKGSFAEAAAAYTRALELKADAVEVRIGRGEAYLRLGDRERAMADFAAAAEPEPATAAGWFYRATANSKRGQWDQALADYGRAIELEPALAHAWNGRGQVYSQLKQWDGAIADHSRAIELDPTMAQAWGDRGSVYCSLGQWQKARDDCSRAIELDPWLTPAWSNRGTAYSNLGQGERAVADHSRAIELDPTLAMPWANRGGAYAQLGQWDRALADSSRAIELDPRLAVAWSNRGAIYTHLQQWDKALTDCSRAIELDPALARAFNNRASVYGHQRKWDQALADLTRTVELEPKLATAWYNRGVVNAALMKWEPALADFSKVIELQPGDAAARYNRGTVYGKLGRWDGAAADYARAFELAPKNNAYRSALVAAHYRRGDYRATVAMPEKAPELDRDGDTGDWLYIAMAHWQLGDKEKARAWYDRAASRANKDPAPGAELKALLAEAERLMAKLK